MWRKEEKGYGQKIIREREKEVWKWAYKKIK